MQRIDQRLLLPNCTAAVFAHLALLATSGLVGCCGTGTDSLAAVTYVGTSPGVLPFSLLLWPTRPFCPLHPRQSGPPVWPTHQAFAVKSLSHSQCL